VAHIAVIGAGVTGITTTYALIDRGHKVTVFDRHRYAAMETSFANGGQLSASNAEVWNQPCTLLRAIRWLWKSDAPLLLNLTPSWHKYSWLAEFVAQIPHYRRNTVATVKLALEARRAIFALAEREGIQFDLEKRGILHIYRDRRSFQHATRINHLLRDGGLERYAVNADEIQEIEPTLHGTYYGGFYTPSDATGDIHKFTRGLAAACARLRAQFVYDADVQRVSASNAGVRVQWKTTDGSDNKQESLADPIRRSGQYLSRKGLFDHSSSRRSAQPRRCALGKHS
jgi:D-amino-acid dehydrogenase